MVADMTPPIMSPSLVISLSSQLAVKQANGWTLTTEYWQPLLYSPYCWMSFATKAVQPVWWLAPMPAPLSPWKYS